MLKHDTNEEQASQVRVTPEELAAAISRLEARKDDSQRHAEGTVAIGEVVQQLGLDAAPEELLAEVRTIRQEPMRAKKRRPSVAGRFVLLLGLGGILLGLALVENSLSQMRSHQAAVSSNVSNVPRQISLAPNLLVGDASGKLVMLSEVSDNQPVRCTFNNQGSYFFQYFPSNTLPSWTLIKHNGKVYVRGRMLRASSGVLMTYGMDVANVDSDPLFAVPVTLPLNGFQVLPNCGNDCEFHAVNVHLDKHAYEKWKP